MTRLRFARCRPPSTVLGWSLRIYWLKALTPQPHLTPPRGSAFYTSMIHHDIMNAISMPDPRPVPWLTAMDTTQPQGEGRSDPSGLRAWPRGGSDRPSPVVRHKNSGVWLTGIASNSLSNQRGGTTALRLPNPHILCCMTAVEICENGSR